MNNLLIIRQLTFLLFKTVRFRAWLIDVAMFAKVYFQSFSWGIYTDNTTSINRLKNTCRHNKTGQVIFIGAGSGDPELLTIKALKAFKIADTVFIDWLVNPEINAYIPNHVERLFVGKKCGEHSMQQKDICQLLVDYASSGKTVLRLKGGDPSIFARLAEETEVLMQAKIAFQVIPGVTAASGCAAYSGIPLTHRDCAQSVKFVTAHLKNSALPYDWSQLANESGTLVFYMGLNRVKDIAQALVKHGMRAHMPIAVIDRGTSDSQKLFCGQLDSIDVDNDLKGFQGPALIIIGEVVNHRVNVDTQIVNRLSLSYNQATTLTVDQ
jgi:uroporphyrin-III C-methyltransferase